MLRILFFFFLIPFVSFAAPVTSYTQLNVASGGSGNSFSGEVVCSSAGQSVSGFNLFLYNETAVVKTLNWSFASTTGTLATPSSVGYFNAYMNVNNQVPCQGTITWNVNVSTTTNPISYAYSGTLASYQSTLFTESFAYLKAARFNTTTTTYSTTARRFVASVLYLDNQTSTSSSMSAATTTVITSNDQAINFFLLYIVFIITIWFVVFIFKPFYNKYGE